MSRRVYEGKFLGDKIRMGLREDALQVATHYDQIANDYQTAYIDPISLWEDSQVKILIYNLMRERKPRVIFDLGCGTGLFCDLVPELKSSVVGVDVSMGMLSLAVIRHPEASWIWNDLREWTPAQEVRDEVDLIVSLYASLSVACVEGTQDWSHIFSLARPGAKFLFMFYAENEGNRHVPRPELNLQIDDPLFARHWDYYGLQDALFPYCSELHITGLNCLFQGPHREPMLRSRFARGVNKYWTKWFPSHCRYLIAYGTVGQRYFPPPPRPKGPNWND